MNSFKFSCKLILQTLFVIIFFSTLNATNHHNFEKGNYISDYFSGILHLNNNQYLKSYNSLNKLNGLEKSHINYSSRYIFSLVNLGKLNEAFNFSKKLEKKNLSNFESDLVIGVYYLKKENYNLAKKYFSKINKSGKTSFLINKFISKSILDWVSFKDMDLKSAQEKINSIDSRFENLKKIQNIFLHCFYRSKKADYYFENLSSNKDVDFSRYSYFYASYLFNEGKMMQAKKVINNSIKLYPRNLLLNQYKLDLEDKKFKSNFDCQNLSNIIAEIFYITANALSSQRVYDLSNFYLNLSKYLNKDFHSFDALIAENFYKIENFEQAKKIYNKIGKRGNAYLWYAAIQNAKILNKEKQKEKSLQILTNAYDKLVNKNVYQKFDYAKFLKNNDQYENSIKLYTEIIRAIKKDHPLYAESTDGRGVSYERIGEWRNAEKDLLSSLEASPNQAYVINYLAYSWIEQGIKIEQSLEMLEKANNLKPNDPYIIDSLGWALFKLERYSDSKNYLQLAVKFLPADPVINDHYGDALWKNDNRIQARYYWNYVLNLKETKKSLKDSVEEKLISGL